MAKNRRVPKPKKAKPARIPEPVVPQVKNDEWPLLRFQHADTARFEVFSWSSDEKDDLFRFFVKVEKTRWPDIYKTSGRPGRKVGLGYTPIPNDRLPAALPKWISPDVTVFELRVCERKRVFAYRTGDVCNVIWYDREHVL